MYTVYDFINNDIEAKHMKTGWKLEISKHQLIVLRYTVLNFDWKSLDFIGNDVWNMFLKSKSYSNMMNKLANARKKYSRLYVEGYGISDLKAMSEYSGLKVDVDRIVARTVAKKSLKIQEDNKIKERLRELSDYV